MTAHHNLKHRCRLSLGQSILSDSTPLQFLLFPLISHYLVISVIVCIKSDSDPETSTITQQKKPGIPLRNVSILDQTRYRLLEATSRELTMGLQYEQSTTTTTMSGPNGPSPLTNGAPKIHVNGTSTPGQEVPMSANDNIRRFDAPSRVLSPQQHALFHNKTRCFV